MLDDLIQASEELRKQLLAAVTASEMGLAFDLNGLDQHLAATGEARGSAPVDLIINANEINNRHGTGVLLQRIFPATEAMISIRSRTQYGNEQTFGAQRFCLPRPGMPRKNIFRIIQQWVGQMDVRRILCVPYYPDDALMAIAAKEIFGAPLCTYVMDDQNITCSGIPDELMRELIERSAFRLAISPDMRAAYETKYRRNFWVMPPLVAPNLITSEPVVPEHQEGFGRVGVLPGNIWGQRWLDLLRETVRGSGIKILWYCNAGNSPSWLKFDRHELEQDGIVLCDALPESEMAKVLRQHAFALMPSGTLDKRDDNSAVATLSLPTRVPFILASSNVPILVMGNPKVASARFVRRFQIGEVCDYRTESFVKAVEKLSSKDTQTAYRSNACKMAKGFSAAGAVEWIWRSLEKGEPTDDRFEALLPRGSDFAHYIEPPVPPFVIPDLVGTYTSLRRLKNRGFDPDFVFDIGSSTGVWSHHVNSLFPRARFLLVDPIASLYDPESTNYHTHAHKNFELVELALADKPGKTKFKIAGNLYGSSILNSGDGIAAVENEVEVEVTTLDLLAKQEKVAGRGLVKMDVQFAEHMVIAGGREFLAKQADAVIIELSLYRYSEGSKTFVEILSLMESLGFRYYDDADEWRAIDGSLMQKDGVFLRRDFFPDTRSL